MDKSLRAQENIWKMFSDKGDTTATFEDWSEWFGKNRENQKNVHTFLRIKGYDITDNFENWQRSVVGESYVGEHI